ncbi:tail completion protein gp17 [Pacificoceanicola onchidii]|uniref:tail completion protein gp17 n=1 Tax=Pacificoceanicola onchidii TaxID=2562685 RepID=UPI0010A4F516|nr:DUF3168 domain-containing protein [Pacificoceanicola onchidii]
MNEALTALMLGHAPLAALVENRVHWRMQPRSVSGFPYVNLAVISDPRAYHMAGASALRSTRVQVDAWAETYAAAKAVSRTVDDFLSGYRGTSGGIHFQGVFVSDERDLTDKTTGEERQLFRISVDLQISWYKEA